MARQQELIKGSIDSLLLCLLGQQPMYGYQIIKELEGRSQGYFKYKEGTLYPALHRMEKTGLLTATWQNAGSSRQRRYYHLTEKGYAVLHERRGQWLDFFNAMNTFIRPASV
jgi:PadR family transcriptional regulator PadR